MIKALFFAVTIFALSTGLNAQEEEKPKEGGFGGLFKKLKNVVEEVSPPSDKPDEEGKSWLERARELGTSTFEKGKKGFDEMVTSGSEANLKFQELLVYLDKKVAGREPSFSNSEIQAMATGLIPLVEEASGRQFKSAPKVAITGNFEMIRILGNDLVPQYEKQFPNSSKSAIYLRSFISAGLFSPGLMGKYGVTDKAVYVLPENIKSVMEEAKIPGELEKDLMKIIIAHELTHALQDQEIDLNRSIVKAGDADESLAFQAMIEGHAVYIQNAVAKKLGLDAAADEGRRILTAPEHKDEEWLLNRVAMADAVRWESIYLGGEKFISHHVAKGGMEKVWAMMESPPSRTSMIVKPASYTVDAQTFPDYNKVFADARKVLGVPDWACSAEPMGDFFIQSYLGAVSRGQRESIMKGLRESVMLQITNSSQGMIGAVVLKFADDAGAKNMLEAVEQLNQYDLDSAEASVLVELISQKKIDYDLGGGVAGSALRYKTKSLILGEEVTSVIQVRQGRQVAQIFYSDVDLKKAPVDDFLRSVLTKLK